MFVAVVRHLIAAISQFLFCWRLWSYVVGIFERESREMVNKGTMVYGCPDDYLISRDCDLPRWGVINNGGTNAAIRTRKLL